jgi:hypothetical protein
LKLPSQIKDWQKARQREEQRASAERAQREERERQQAAIAPSPDEKIASPISKATIAPSPDEKIASPITMAVGNKAAHEQQFANAAGIIPPSMSHLQLLQVQSSADEWSSVRETVRGHQREDDAASLSPSTFSRVSCLPSHHSQQRVVERGISEHQIKQAKVTGRMSLAVRFDDDYLEQQARTQAREWGEQLKAALAGLSLVDAKPKGPPGDRRIEVELVRSEGRARDVKRWLVDNSYFSNRNRVLYILRLSAREEIVVVEGLIDDQIDDIGIITVIRRVDKIWELKNSVSDHLRREVLDSPLDRQQQVSRYSRILDLIVDNEDRKIRMGKMEDKKLSIRHFIEKAGAAAEEVLRSLCEHEIELQGRGPSNYKTKLCLKWQQHGKFSNGNRCNFAHGSNQLRPSGCVCRKRGVCVCAAGAAPAAPAANQNIPWCSRKLVPWNGLLVDGLPCVEEMTLDKASSHPIGCDEKFDQAWTKHLPGAGAGEHVLYVY